MRARRGRAAAGGNAEEVPPSYQLVVWRKPHGETHGTGTETICRSGYGDDAVESCLELPVGDCGVPVEDSERNIETARTTEQAQIGG